MRIYSSSETPKVARHEEPKVQIAVHPKGDKAGNVVERSLEKTVGE